LDDEHGFFSYILGIKKPDQVKDQAVGFLSDIKKAPHFHVRPFWLLVIGVEELPVSVY
jgi:hypothetical protein